MSGVVSLVLFSFRMSLGVLVLFNVADESLFHSQLVVSEHIAMLKLCF